MVVVAALSPPEIRDSARIVSRILAWLDNRRTRQMEMYPERVRRTYDLLSQTYRPIGDDALEALIVGKQRVNLLESAAFVHLETSKDINWLVPVLSAKFDLGRRPVEVRFRVAVFESVEDGPELKLTAIGYRFESPEGSPSIHGYWHVQPIGSFDRSDRWSLPCTAPPMSTQLPAIALDATNVAALLVSVLISIYGMAAIDQILKTADFWPAVQSAVKPMHCVGAPSEAAAVMAVGAAPVSKKALKAQARERRVPKR